MADKKSIQVSLPIPGLLGLLFIGLKLTGHIDWSWLWVLSPFWIPFAIIAAVFGSIIGFGLLAAGASFLLNYLSRRR